MIVLITGASGFIAKHLASFLNQKGYRVDGVSSTGLLSDHYRRIYTCTLGKALPLFSDTYDLIIHCAYDHTASSEYNSQATVLWAESLLQQGNKRQMFLSTIGVVSGNTSMYARSKADTEKWFQAHQMYIVRPGLVVGNGGLFAKIIKKVRSFPILPLIDGGKQKIKLIGIVDLLAFIEKIMIEEQNSPTQEYNLFYTSEPSLSELLRQLAKFYKRTIMFIPIPFGLIYRLIWCIEKLHFNIGISTVNLIGLQQNEKNVLSSIKDNISLKECFERNLSC
jgi:nucleoside-diphosphate-sugar epimerase